MLYTLKHMSQTCTQSLTRMRQRLLMAGVVGRVDAIATAKELLALPVAAFFRNPRSNIDIIYVQRCWGGQIGGFPKNQSCITSPTRDRG